MGTRNIAAVVDTVFRAISCGDPALAVERNDFVSPTEQRFYQWRAVPVMVKQRGFGVQAPRLQGRGFTRSCARYRAVERSPASRGLAAGPAGSPPSGRVGGPFWALARKFLPQPEASLRPDVVHGEDQGHGVEAVTLVLAAGVFLYFIFVLEDACADPIVADGEIAVTVLAGAGSRPPRVQCATDHGPALVADLVRVHAPVPEVPAVVGHTPAVQPVDGHVRKKPDLAGARVRDGRLGVDNVLGREQWAEVRDVGPSSPLWPTLARFSARVM